MSKIEVGTLQDWEVTFRVAKDTTFNSVVYLKGAVADPAVVTYEIMPPDGIKRTYVYNAVGSPVVSVSTGVYSVPVMLDQDGNWEVVCTGSGAGGPVAVVTGGIVVNRRPFP